MGEKRRRIWRSAPMRNSRKLKRGRSRVVPRRSQTLASSSKVDKCEIQLDADPIQGASGGARQVSNFEAKHRGPSSRPPLDLLNIPDEFKTLETDRLLPCDLKNASPSAMQQYDAYLQWFYSSHRGPVPVSVADTASKYLEEEKSMNSLWVNSHACSNIHDPVLVDCIYGYMDIAITDKKSETKLPYAFDAAECLSKEAELICEWLRHGRHIFTDDEYALCYNIRFAAAELFITRRKSSFHISAALLGIKREAEWLIENLKRNSGESISTSMKIRQFALDFLWEKFDELEPVYDWGNEGGNVELSEVETASKSDDDVAEELSEVETASKSDDDDVSDNYYVGGCSDETYMKPYTAPWGLL